MRILLAFCAGKRHGHMDDLFAIEQQVYDDAVRRVKEVKKGAEFDFVEYIALANEYGYILKQLRRTTRVSDKTTASLMRNNLDLFDKVHYDQLTGIYNRRYMEESLAQIIKSLSRADGVLSIMLIDIDFFKQYNDAYGHSQGDKCLKLVAKALAQCISRNDDIVARYGGEEFIVILPHTDETGVHVTAGKLLESVKELNIPHENSSVADHVTISVGATTVRVEHTHDYLEYIELADSALYMSKHHGRNSYTYTRFEEVSM
jgi:diguanylate cyclase (GGDEF)-like protein